MNTLYDLLGCSLLVFSVVAAVLIVITLIAIVDERSLQADIEARRNRRRR